MVMISDAGCLGNIYAQATLELQAGFRPGFAPCLPGKSYQDSVIFSVTDRPKCLCSRFLTYMMTKDIKTRLSEHEVGLDLNPLRAGHTLRLLHIYAFNRWR